MSAAGLPEFVCSSHADYEALALRCARDAEFLRAAKDKLVLGRATSALFDVERYTRNLENAYVTMWERLQKGMPPERISIV